MSSESALSLKIGTRPTSRKRSAFSPDMLRALCAVAGEAFTALLETRVTVTFDTIGLESMADALPKDGKEICGAIAQVNGMDRAMTILPDAHTLFHVTDLLLGGDPGVNEPIIERGPSSLDDRFCGTFADMIIASLATTCDSSLGRNSFVRGPKLGLVHDLESLAIVPAATDILTISFSIAFGREGRSGSFILHLPLHVVDSISVAAALAGVPVEEDGPWFKHMKSTVAQMELEVQTHIHTERMTLAALSRLEIGQILPVENDAIGAVQVVLEDGGEVLLSGELGTRSGRRAVSIGTPPDPKFLDPAARLLAK